MPGVFAGAIGTGMFLAKEKIMPNPRCAEMWEEVGHLLPFGEPVSHNAFSFPVSVRPRRD